MTWEQYWYGDVWMVEAARKANKLWMQRENSKAHLLGMYIYEALCDVSPVLQAFAKKGTKPVPYRTRPYDIGNESKPQAEKDQEAENERLKAQLFFRNWARATMKHFQASKSGNNKTAPETGTV